MKNFILSICFLCGLNLINAQSVGYSRALLEEGASLLNEGYPDAGMEKLKMAQGFDPQNESIDIEMARAHFMLKEYNMAIDLLSPILSSGRASPKVFQILGNSMDMLGYTNEAIEVYLEGVVNFPNSGNLYLELGIVEWVKGKKEIALSYWEQGIENDPSFPSNYYWAAIGFSESSEPIRTLIYGEVYMNMDHTSERNEEMSKLLYNLYKSNIHFKDSVLLLSFSEPDKMVIDTAGSIKAKNISLEEAILIVMYTIPDMRNSEISLEILNKVRLKFLQKWQDRFARKMDVAIFSWWDELNDLGILSGYNYWMFRMGNPEEYNYWYERNRIPNKQFEMFFDKFPMDIFQEKKLKWNQSFNFEK